ncbi:uncharacterized protein BYT42DRAFT_565197, partial [Radiomyces spectabilis]|uniref:uncharacterized protein n=1 Tax=Radiomyces spectabilis TaxID=64574 RepID=UPI0022205FCD
EQQSILFVPFFSLPSSVHPIILQLTSSHFYLVTIKPRHRIKLLPLFVAQKIYLLSCNL